MIARFVMQTILFILAVVGGYTVAGWVGVAVAAAFIVTMFVDVTLRMRSPKARILRQIAHDLREVDEDDLIVARVTKVAPCDCHAHPMYGAHNQPTTTITSDDED